MIKQHESYITCLEVRERLTYFDIVFDLKRQLPAHIENLHTISQDLYVSCRHRLLVMEQQKEKMEH